MTMIDEKPKIILPREAELDREIERLIEKMLNDELTPLELTAFKQLSSERGVLMRPRRPRIHWHAADRARLSRKFG
jgi:hypothetical protein